MRVPLGLPHTPDPADVAPALEFITTGRPVGFVPQGALRGLRLVATDLDRTWGDGDPLEGRGIDLLMAACGRTALLPALTGAGVPCSRGGSPPADDRVEPPAVRVNQLGYLPGAPQQATLVTARPRRWSSRSVGGGGGPGRGRPIHVRARRARPRLHRGRRAWRRAHHRRRRGEPPVPGRAGRLRGSRRRRAGVLPPHALRPPRHRRRRLDRPGRRRLYPGWHPTGRFDVSGGWYDAGDYGKYVASGSLPAWQLLRPVAGDRTDECRGSSTGCCGCWCPPGSPFAGHGVPPRPRHRVVTAAGPAARGPDRRASCTVPRRPRRCTWPPSPPRPPALPRRRRLAARLLAAARRAHAAAHRHPGWSPRTTRAASAAAPTATTGSTTTSTGPRRSCGWPRATDRSSPSSWRAPTTPATCSTSRGSTSTASLRPPASTWRSGGRRAAGPRPGAGERRGGG